MQSRLIQREPVTLMSYLTKLKATFTVVYTTGVFTSSGHGLANGDVVLLSNSGGALPAGSDNTTKYYVNVIDANTFYLYTDSQFKTVLALTGNGTGTNSFNLQCKVINIVDFVNIEVDIETANSINVASIKCQISNEKSCPNFATAQSNTNVWKYAQMKLIDTGASVNGSTGITDLNTGTDAYRTYETNTNGFEWLCFQIGTVTAGTINIKVRGYGNI